MAIGDTVNAGLMRIDTSAYERAGQANANANMAFGNALNQVAKGFIEGREKKARANEIKEELMRQGVPEDAAGNISKNPFLQKERARQEAAKQQMQIEGNRIAVQREGIRSSARSASDSNALKSRSMDMAQEGVDSREAKIAEAEQITGEANQFMRTRPQTEAEGKTSEFSNLLQEFSPDQIPGTPEFEEKELSEPMGARPPLMASFATDKPNFEMFNVGKAPIEQQLPESFQGLAGQIIDRIDNGEISKEAGDLALNRIRGQAMAEQKAGPTRSEILAREQFEYKKATDDEKNKPMPPVDSKYEEATLTAVDDALGFLTDDTKKFFSTGVIGQALSNVAGTDATSLRSKLDTITSGVGFGRLNDMREASKTGGALGNVSEIELRQLNASMGSLNPNQKPSELKKTLETIKKHYESTVRVLKAEKYAYDNGYTFKTPKEAMDFVERYNNLNASSPQQTDNTIDPSAPASQATLDVLEKKRQLRSKRAGL